MGSVPRVDSLPLARRRAAGGDARRTQSVRRAHRGTCPSRLAARRSRGAGWYAARFTRSAERNATPKAPLPRTMVELGPAIISLAPSASVQSSPPPPATTSPAKEPQTPPLPAELAPAQAEKAAAPAESSRHRLAVRASVAAVVGGVGSFPLLGGHLTRAASHVAPRTAVSVNPPLHATQVAPSQPPRVVRTRDVQLEIAAPRGASWLEVRSAPPLERSFSPAASQRDARCISRDSGYGRPSAPPGIS